MSEAIHLTKGRRFKAGVKRPPGELTSYDSVIRNVNRKFHIPGENRKKRSPEKLKKPQSK